MTQIHNRSEQKETRRRLRKDAPKAEGWLWSRLRANQMDGLKFRRQHGIGPYVVDFYCARAALVIELDGDSHIGEAAHAEDLRRQAFIEAQGLHVLRFANQDVYHRLENMLQAIWNVASERITTTRGDVCEKNPPQSPLGKGGR